MDTEARTTEEVGQRLRARIDRLFGRSLHIRHVDTGSCNGCELELNALSNPYYDISRLGVFFATSPRHADMLLVTGPVTRAMEIPLRVTYDAMPSPKLVVAAGVCACDGGMYRFHSYSSATGLDQFLPVDAYIPGCPPSPLALIQGIMLALDRVEQQVHSHTITIPFIPDRSASEESHG
ncbi:MAG: NADH-quinone oxidoreductase subunit B family protein [Chloroflexota bacterium]